MQRGDAECGGADAGGAVLDAGRLKVEVSTALPLRDARRGHELSETRHTRGKIVLQAQGEG